MIYVWIIHLISTHHKGYPAKPLAFPNYVFCTGTRVPNVMNQTNTLQAVCGECGNFVSQLAERRQLTSQL